MIARKYAEVFARSAQVSLEIAEREIVLTYALKILDEDGFLKNLAFKGGTCLRKCVYGKDTRFSMDMDFTHLGGSDPDDAILEIAEAFTKTSYGIAFKTNTEDFYVSNDKRSCGAHIRYSHEWNQGGFDLEFSFRERPSLPLVMMELKPQPYFKYLEFKPFPIPCFRFEELLAEKIRAASQRIRSRDLYDLFHAAEKPFNAPLIRALTVVKCWNVRHHFEPQRFFDKMRSGRQDWDDLARLIQRSRRIDPEKMIGTCERRYRFLREFTEDENQLVADARRHHLNRLPEKILSRLEFQRQ